MKSGCSIVDSSVLAGNRLKVTVSDVESKRSLLSLRGIKFNREKIFITEFKASTNNATASATASTTNIISMDEVVPLAFDATKGVLLLDSFPVDLNSRKNTIALFDCISRQPWCGSVTALSLANCKITSLKPFLGIMERTLPSLIRLNLSGNLIRSFRDLNLERNLCQRLVHLILKDTPLFQSYQLNAEKMKIYFLEIIKMCPAIQIIDDQSFTPEERITLQKNASVANLESFVFTAPLSSNGSFFDQETTRNAVYTFLNQ